METKQGKIKYAVVGMGFIFGRHKQAIEATGGEVILTCDNDPAKGADVTDWVAMMHHPKFQEVDVVVICTPNYLHSVMVREALIRGKKVLCEKPLTIDGFTHLEGVSTVLQLRYSPEVNRIKEKKPVRVGLEISMLRKPDYFAGWKGNVYLSGGILFNLGIHYVDLLVYLLGDPQQVLEANSLFVPKDKHWEEDFKGLVRFDGGIGEIYISLNQDDGTYKELKPSRKLKATYADGTSETIELSNKENLSYEGLHLEVYKDFIQGKGVTLSEAEKSLKLVHDLLLKNDGN